MDKRLITFVCTQSNTFLSLFLFFLAKRGLFLLARSAGLGL